MSKTSSIAGAEWLRDSGLKGLLAALTEGGEEARIAGGAVRNALLGEAVSDIDIATTNTPDQTMERAKAAGFKAIPTGFDHGTVTVVAKGQAYEVTTLRADVETNGRHAKVAFGRDWKQDAERRDFTINALYAEADGTVIDFVGGLADLESRTLRFIGDAEARIREDYLRILRFFRFFAWYGSGRPDSEGLKACARLKSGVETLSVERVWVELKKLLSAPDPSRALLWMRQSGVLTAALPESEKWGIDAIHGLVKSEQDLGWPSDPLLRLASMVPPDPQRMRTLADRLRLSKAEAARLENWALARSPSPTMIESELAKILYRENEQGLKDRLHLLLASARAKAAESDAAMIEAGGYSRLLAFMKRWQRPVFPLNGADIAEFGIEPGKVFGETLKKLENEWVESGFSLDRDALLARAAQAAGN
ncbi:CCA tRNA nucleotidyltransferase [Mesorhizobium sp. SB112]|uniref:CCA tRNA nucleotidyltransferase n=1 Tax=Mesorhizobium sp. SB112 TaxID=3151853 RepID=UPI003263F33D